jgi:hypothetical protein
MMNISHVNTMMEWVQSPHQFNVSFDPHEHHSNIDLNIFLLIWHDIKGFNLNM